MSTRNIDIVISARDNASAGFASAQSSALNFGLRLGGAFAAVRLATAGVEIARAGVRAYKGDWEGVSQALDKFPFGFGQFHAAAREAAQEWSGLAEETRKAKEQAAGWQKVAAGIMEAGRREAQFQLKARLLFLPPTEREISAINEEAKKATAEALAKAKEEGRGPKDLSTTKELANIETWRAQAAGEIRRKARDKEIADTAAGMEARNKIEDADAEQKVDQARKAADEIKKREETTAAQRREIADRMFNLTHDAREREVKDLDNYYADMIEKAAGGLAQIAEIQAAYAVESVDLMDRQREAAEAEFGASMAGGGPLDIEAPAARTRRDYRFLESRFLAGRDVLAGTSGDPAAADRRAQLQSLKKIEGLLSDIRGKEPVVLNEGKV